MATNERPRTLRARVVWLVGGAVVLLGGFLLLLSLLDRPSAEVSSVPVSEGEPGVHLGFGTFSPVTDTQLPALDARIAEATAAGMDVARVMVDWAEIETGPGAYDWSLLDDQLERVPNGTRLFLTLGVTDVDRYAVPEDLLGSDSGLAAPLDDPAVTGRYLSLLDAVLPRLIAEHQLFALSVANEPDVLLEERSAEQATALAAFTSAVGDYASDRFPGLAVTMTISGPAVTYSSALLPELIAATDVAAFNWGCIDLTDFTVTDPSTIRADIALLLAAAGDRDIILQELSCPAGYADAPSTIGGSPEHQAVWFEAFFAAMRAEPRFAAAFVFDVVDWPEEVAAAYSDVLRDEGMEEIADRYEELQRTWGMLTFDDLSPKPAWGVFLSAIS